MSDTDVSNPKVSLNDSARASAPTGARTGGNTESAGSIATEIVFETQGANALAPVIEIDRLWDAAPGTSSKIVSAIALLKQVSDFLAEAQRSDNPMEADRFVQRAQLALPKLFAYRSIGDGYGLIVNSLHFAFSNLHGTPLSAEQCNLIWRVLRELRNRPVMSVETALQRIEEFEGVGLRVDPPEIGSLLEEAESAENE